MISFRAFGIPIAIKGSFLLVAALIGWLGRMEPAEIAVWVGVVFVSILIHEFGHAFVARAFGAQVAIELNGVGGLTRWVVTGDAPLGPGRRALVAAAGSAVGVVFGGIVFLVAQPFGPYSGLASFAITRLIGVNVFWGLINWLPVRPLDGGHLVESLLEKVVPKRADMIASVIFTVAAAAALAWALANREFIIAPIAAFLLFGELRRGRPVEPIPELSYGEDVESGAEETDGSGAPRLENPPSDPDFEPDR